MSGTIHYVKNNKKNKITNTSFYNSPKLPTKHNHIEIFFDDCKIVYNDPRRFGFLRLLKMKNTKEKFNHLGPEPFHLSYNLDYIYFKLRGKEILKIF